MIGTRERRITLAASEDSLARFSEFVNSCLDDAGLVGSDPRDAIARALDKALASIVVCAADAIRQQGTNDYQLELSIDIDSTRLKVAIAEGWRDYGSSDSISDADLLAEAHRMRGKEFSMRSLCGLFDEISYAFKKGFQNELVLIKFL
ncbi:MAG: hypothetical protein AB7K09_25750 [Planctomycetota bacterium]